MGFVSAFAWKATPSEARVTRDEVSGERNSVTCLEGSTHSGY